jgi:hypothetical protein
MMNFLTIFKEENGQWSVRRILAFISLFAAVALAYAALDYNGWYVYIPMIVLTAFSALMLFFTTWSDIKDVVAAAKGK